jgi:hypothetical protein
MINHVRTHLLNRGRDGFAHTFPGEEYVPTTYQPRTLNGAASRLWQALFGHAPDRLFLNFRLYQYCNLLHTSELLGHVYYRDKRITYWPLPSERWQGVFETRLETGNHVIGGTHVCDESRGVCQEQWRLSPSNTEVVVRQLTGRGMPIQTHALTFTNGLSQPVPLAGTDLTIQIRRHETKSFLVESAAAPTTETGVLLLNCVAAVGAGSLDDFFAGDTEPFSTWRTVWRTHPSDMTRLAALLLAMAHAVESTPIRSA